MHHNTPLRRDQLFDTSNQVLQAGSRSDPRISCQITHPFHRTEDLRGWPTKFETPQLNAAVAAAAVRPTHSPPSAKA
ncbi:hypothetical protein I7I53_02677 [Histoplasma capsulatum var. duboisii H88]|uniref:Uncharacterized protein n=1 Tax=Ajellomyces capsulatus (strain H88) TaxID=544711 RepID=A0A8A1LLU9_AJEC8|nr:hypothetical protein I7I53_02677 [Histoplasma capsulatum var. duboisii H88]